MDQPLGVVRAVCKREKTAFHGGFVAQGEVEGVLFSGEPIQDVSGGEGVGDGVEITERAAFTPFGVDGVDDELAGDGIVRTVFGEPVGFELGEFGGVFAVDDQARREDAVFGGVLAGDGFAFGRSGSGMAAVALFHLVRVWNAGESYFGD